MALFGRSKNKDLAEQDGAEQDGTEQDGAVQDTAAPEENAAEAPAPAETLRGPLDASERKADERYLDFGAVKVLPAEEMMIRIEVDPTSESIVAVTVEKDGSTMQLQAFAAPKTTGLWEELREEIARSVSAQGGSSDEVEGLYGQELFAKLPQITPEGRPGYRNIRFIGIDRPRWFLRAVLSGQAAVSEEAAAPLTALLEDIIVDRGREPMPPRSLLSLSVPDQTPANVAPVGR